MPGSFKNNILNLKKDGAIAHIWADYVPNSFIEPHDYLLNNTNFDSLNLVSHLWDNNSSPSSRVKFLQKLPLNNLVNPTLYYRLLDKITRKTQWQEFREMCERELQKKNIKLIHSHFGTTGCEMTSVVSRSRLPHVVSFYGYDASASLSDNVTVTKYKSMFKHANKIIVLCKEVKARLVALGCDDRKIVVWNMPAGVEQYPFEEKLFSENIRILMAARFVEAKGHRYALDALEVLLKRGNNVSLTIVGYGNHSTEIEKMIRSRRLENRVRFINNELKGNFKKEFKVLVSESDILIQPSIRDSNGVDEAGPALSMICGQAGGLPVICTPFPGSEISLIDGVTGLFCAEKSGDSLADKIESLIQQPELAMEMGKNGSRLVNAEFSESKQMKKLIEIYKQAIEENTSALEKSSTIENLTNLPKTSNVTSPFNI